MAAPALVRGGIAKVTAIGVQLVKTFVCWCCGSGTPLYLMARSCQRSCNPLIFTYLQIPAGSTCATSHAPIVVGTIFFIDEKCYVVISGPDPIDLSRPVSHATEYACQTSCDLPPCSSILPFMRGIPCIPNQNEFGVWTNNCGKCCWLAGSMFGTCYRFDPQESAHALTVPPGDIYVPNVDCDIQTTCCECDQGCPSFLLTKYSQMGCTSPIFVGTCCDLPIRCKTVSYSLYVEGYACPELGRLLPNTTTVTGGYTICRNSPGDPFPTPPTCTRIRKFWSVDHQEVIIDQTGCGPGFIASPCPCDTVGGATCSHTETAGCFDYFGQYEITNRDLNPGECQFVFGSRVIRESYQTHETLFDNVCNQRCSRQADPFPVPPPIEPGLGVPPSFESFA